MGRQQIIFDKYKILIYNIYENEKEIIRRVKHFEGFVLEPEVQLEDFLNKNFITQCKVVSISYTFDNRNRPHILLVYEDD